MPSRWEQYVGLLQLLRTPLIFVAVSNIWLAVFLADSGVEQPGRVNPALDELGMGWVLLLTAIVAAGLQGYGSAMNDVLDTRHDRVFHPNRPLARGVVARPVALAISVVALLAAFAAVQWLGIASTSFVVAVAAGILFYNTAGKFLPGVGIVTLGLVRAALMFTPNPHLAFAWPMLLALTHTMACTAIAYTLQGKRPQLQGGRIWQVAAGWTFWVTVIVVWISRHEQGLRVEQTLIWLGPIIAMAVFAVISHRVVTRQYESRHAERVAGANYFVFAMIWLIAYDASWLAAAGQWQAALALAGLFIVAVVWWRLLGVPTVDVGGE